MKKWILFFGVFAFLGMQKVVAQLDTLTLARPELKELLQTIKQDAVMDTASVKEKRDAISAIEGILKSTDKTGIVVVPRDYVLKYIERLTWDYQQMERYEDQKNKLLRITAQYYAKDKKLKALTKQNSNGVPEYYRFNELKDKLRKELKYEATLNKKTYELINEAAKKAVLNENIEK